MCADTLVLKETISVAHLPDIFFYSFGVGVYLSSTVSHVFDGSLVASQ